MTDAQALELLRLLHVYVTLYDNREMTISEVAEDLAMSMDVTTDEADRIRQVICG